MRSFGGRGTIPALEVTLDEVPFELGILPTGKANSLMHAIKGALGPVLQELLAGAANADLDSLMDVEGAALGKGIARLFEGLTEQLITRAFNDLAAVSQVKDDSGQLFDLANKAIFEEVFQGRPLLYHKFIIAGLKHNFSDFLSGTGDMQALLQAALKKKETPSQRGSIGGNTES